MSPAALDILDNCSCIVLPSPVHGLVSRALFQTPFDNLLPALSTSYVHVFVPPSVTTGFLPSRDTRTSLCIVPWSRLAAFVPKGISFGHTPCISAFGTIQEKKAFMWLRCGGFIIWKLTYSISVFVSFSYMQKSHDGFCKHLWILCLLGARMNDHLLY